jgi:GH25 family lysozyme M1 (1,4-beta-N-acetylmuramidase)
MGVRGIDISNHQAGMDVERVVRDNAIGFVFILSNDGTFKNAYYANQAAAARRGGATVVPYVYLRTNVDQTFATFRQQVPTPGPVIVDVEDGSGGVAECRRMHDLLHAAGYTTPLLYWPDWYRRKVGSPSLAGFPPLWTSWYPDNTSRGFDAGLAMLPAWVWNGYGGLPTRIVQFTSSGRLGGYGANLDLNYFPGSRAELDALLNQQKEAEDMTPDQDARLRNVEEWLQIIATNGWEPFAPGKPRNGPGAGGDLGWFQKQLVIGLKPVTDALAAISDRVARLEASGIPATVDYARVRDEVGDELDKRARDNDPTTGPTS